MTIIETIKYWWCVRFHKGFHRPADFAEQYPGVEYCEKCDHIL